MTETTGYFCPKCLCWWTTYLNRGETLFCGCGSKKAESIWLYRKTWGNTIFGIKEKKVKIEFNSRELVFTFSSSLDKDMLKKFVLWVLLNVPDNETLWLNQNYIYIAVKEALTSASNRGQYRYRCMKCRYFNKIPGQKCEFYEPRAFLDVNCKKFEAKESIQRYLSQYRANTESLRGELEASFKALGCIIDRFNGKIRANFNRRSSI